MSIEIIKPREQAKGMFDGGKFREQRPIGFPGEPSKVSRVGPLFYWAWGHAAVKAEIGLHPHEAFEIITYVINGEAYHFDTLGTRSIVTRGGAQLMQTGSGVSHAETFTMNSEVFQIWFEPHLFEAIQRKPTYSQYEHQEFPLIEKDGVTIKTVLGGDSPMKIVTDASMWDIFLSSNSQYIHHLAKNRALAILAIRGDGQISLQDERASYAHKDFIVVRADVDEEVVIRAQDKDARIYIIEVPENVDYPLYNKG